MTGNVFLYYEWGKLRMGTTAYELAHPHNRFWFAPIEDEI